VVKVLKDLKVIMDPKEVQVLLVLLALKVKLEV